MNSLETVLPLALMMLATGVAGGLLAGLFGVGGGIVIVPVLDIALGVAGVDPAIRMHVAVATSLATIIPTSIASSRAHHGRGAVDIALVRRWAPFILLGVLLGTWLASLVDSQVLTAIFGSVALLVAIKMVLPLDDVNLAQDVPKGPLAALLPASIGCISSMMGIGGGTLGVPILTLLNQAVHRAVGTAALLGLVISIPATVAYIWAGWGDVRLPPASLGYVNVLGFVLIASMTVLVAPWGVKLAHRLSKRTLSSLFGLFLLLVGARMLFRAFTG
ncbi:MAG: sulfite exporter TauE/SafE family protein [Pseudomonadales bacterium]